MGRFNKAPYTLTQALPERVKDAIIVNISEKIFQLQHLYSPIAYDFRVLETDEMLLSQPEQHGVSRSGEKKLKD